ncbi:hypothetical protein BFP72_06230 [Reichenbachiella sp. 5M10]|nr:hypothetical protein BFP72_06230 [Reichenbachiella sp. 5M10]
MTKLVFVNQTKNTEYKVKINPSSIKQTKRIEYADGLPPGVDGGVMKYNRTLPSTITFEIVLDGTGATGLAHMVNDVKKELDKLESVVYSFDGETHEAPQIKIFWGDTKFYGRVTDLDYTHTLFKPGGKPLRTKVSISVVSSQSEMEMAKSMKRSSPDLSHLVVVKNGDTLPMMCQRIYNDSKYYLQVAKINKLMSFRSLEPGMQLLFPPLKK